MKVLLVIVEEDVVSSYFICKLSKLVSSNDKRNEIVDFFGKNFALETYNH